MEKNSFNIFAVSGSARKHLKPIVETETSIGNVYETEADGKAKVIIG